MNEYIVTLIGDFYDFEQEIRKLGKVTYISPVIQGMIGLQSYQEKWELLENSFIEKVEQFAYGTLLKTQ